MKKDDINEIKLPEDYEYPIVGGMIYPPVLEPGDIVGDDAVTLAGNVVFDPNDFGNEPIDIEPFNGMDGRLAGDVVIDLPSGKSERGVVIEPGLAGYIVLPTARRVQNPPRIRQPKNDSYPPLMGSIVLRPNFGTAISAIAAFLEKYKIVNRKELPDESKLIDFMKETKGEFHWNKEYLENKSIASKEKMDCAKDIAIDNLKVIREAAKTYQRELQETDNKGKNY